MDLNSDITDFQGHKLRDKRPLSPFLFRFKKFHIVSEASDTNKMLIKVGSETSTEYHRI